MGWLARTVTRFGAHLSAALVLSAGLVATASAQDEGAVRLSGAVRLGPTLDIATPATPSLLAPIPVLDVAEADPRRSLIETGPDTGSASALPWYERFTIAPSETHAVWAGAPREFQLEAGERWGVTLGYSEGLRSPQDFELDDFSAGAFYNFSERVRVGGQLRFTSPEEEIFGEETERPKTPELRFESAFRF